ncbi:MAG: helix-turn-helix domain-containing protein [Hyphomonadaceae bacterium JAD_PAG50586_4]|jgi:Cu(I)-responsive transcriptional regulator|nr:MAG: helix-turn-helix domain-containing protein [Hyphomonadaceae bacterium JAD_PAG50586_4]
MYPIGETAKRTGIKIPTIRYYEQEGLLPPPRRTQSGRRVYAEAEVQRLAFIRHARTLGFELTDIRSLLDLSDNPDRSCGEADRIARKHLTEIEARLAQLRLLKTELARIVKSCAGGKAAECRIIEALAESAG